MAFGDLSNANTVARNSPRYKRIVEPFGDAGTFAMYPGKKKPKEHILNIEDESIFKIMIFLQVHTGRDKSLLKKMDWVSSIDQFNNLASASPVDGVDFFYRFFYLKKFGVMQKDKELPPLYDPLTFGHDMKSIVFGLPSRKVGLKGVTILNNDPTTMIDIGGSGSFTILSPKKPEHIEVVEKRIPLSGDFFYSKKIKDPIEIIDTVNNSGELFVSHFAQSSIMMATMQVVTNYETKLQPAPIDETGELLK